MRYSTIIENSKHTINNIHFASLDSTNFFSTNNNKNNLSTIAAVRTTEENVCIRIFDLNKKINWNVRKLYVQIDITESFGIDCSKRFRL